MAHLPVRFSVPPAAAPSAGGSHPGVGLVPTRGSHPGPGLVPTQTGDFRTWRVKAVR